MGQSVSSRPRLLDLFCAAGGCSVGYERAGFDVIGIDVGGTGTLTVSAGGTSKVIRVSGAPDIYTVATEQPAKDGTVTVELSPGLAAYSFTFG